METKSWPRGTSWSHNLCHKIYIQMSYSRCISVLSSPTKSNVNRWNKHVFERRSCLLNEHGDLFFLLLISKHQIKVNALGNIRPGWANQQDRNFFSLANQVRCQNQSSCIYSSPAAYRNIQYLLPRGFPTRETETKSGIRERKRENWKVLGARNSGISVSGLIIFFTITWCLPCLFCKLKMFLSLLSIKIHLLIF